MAVDDKGKTLDQLAAEGWKVTTPAAHDGTPEERSAIDRFVEGAWKNTGGAVIGTMKALVPSAVAEAAGAEHPEEFGPAKAIKGIIDAHAEQVEKARTAYKEGRYSEAAGHLAAAALPGVGPAAANAGEKIGAGDVAGGLGEAAGILAPAAHAPVGRAVEAVRGPVGRAVSAVGRGVEDLGASPTARIAAGSAAVNQAVRGDMAGAAIAGAAPVAAAGAGKVLQFIGGKISREAAAAGLSPLEYARRETAAGRPVPPAVLKALEHLDRSVPVQPGTLTPAQLAERINSGTGTPATVARGANGRPVKPPLSGPASAPTGTPIVEPASSSQAAPAVDPRQQAVLPDTRPPAGTQADIDAAQAAHAAGYVAPPTDPATVGTAEPVAPAAAPAVNFSAQKALNEIALGARRLKIKLTGKQERAALDLIKGGVPVSDALVQVVQGAAGDLAALLGTPTAQEVAARVSDRNATGRWSEISGKMGGRHQ